MKKIAVSGASGFVASHLMRGLVSAGYQPVGLSRRDVSLPGCTVRQVSYDDMASLRTALQGVQAVVHLAAEAHAISGGGSTDEVRSRFDANAVITSNLAQAAIECGVSRFIHISSMSVYGASSSTGPYKEDNSFAPADAYAQSKIESENALLRVVRDATLDYVILRPPLVYGPGCHGSFNMLMNLCRKSPLLPFGGLTQPRSFIYVGNLVDAIRACLDHAAVARESFILTDGHLTNVAGMTRRLAYHLRRPAWIHFYFPPPLLRTAAFLAGKAVFWDKLAAPLHADSGKFSRLTGWTPPCTEDAGLEAVAQSLLARPVQ